jgi:uncharacterized protein YndB with AHSA1/START domain
MNITIQTNVHAPLATVWEYWNAPEHITQWCFASDDWQTTDVENDVRVGGTSRMTMSAKDGSAAFTLESVYSVVDIHERIAYTMADGRVVDIRFKQTPEGVEIIETFDAESENPEEMQRAGWQAILNRFTNYVEQSLAR